MQNAQHTTTCIYVYIHIVFTPYFQHNEVSGPSGVYIIHKLRGAFGSTTPNAHPTPKKALDTLQST